MAKPYGILDHTCPVNWAHPLNTGLVGCWMVPPLSGWRGGQTLRDLVRGGHTPNDGTLTSGPTWVGGGRSGGYGAVSVTGGSYVALPFPAVGANDSFTLVVSHRPTTWPGGFTALLDDAGRFWSLFFDTSGNISFNGFLMNPSGSTAMAAGSWWQFVATRDRVSGVTTYYVNGKLINSGTSGNALASALTVRFGSNPSAGGSNYNGSYDDIRLYLKRVLSAGEVAALYDQSRRGHPNTLRWLRPIVYSVPAVTASTVSWFETSDVSYAASG